MYQTVSYVYTLHGWYRNAECLERFCKLKMSGRFSSFFLLFAINIHFFLTTGCWLLVVGGWFGLCSFMNIDYGGLHFKIN